MSNKTHTCSVQYTQGFFYLCYCYLRPHSSIPVQVVSFWVEYNEAAMSNLLFALYYVSELDGYTVHK